MESRSWVPIIEGGRPFLAISTMVLTMSREVVFNQVGAERRKGRAEAEQPLPGPCIRTILDFFLERFEVFEIRRTLFLLFGGEKFLFF